MDPGDVLIELSRLLRGAAEIDDDILVPAGKLIDSIDDMIEVEVARTLVARRLHPVLAPRLFDGEPDDRVAAIRTAGRFYPNSQLANLIRRLVRDPNQSVKFAARQIFWSRKFTDVALPDYRYGPGTGAGPYPLGDYNASGWAAGLFRFSRLRRGGHGYRRVARPERDETAADRKRKAPITDSDQLAQMLGIDGDRIRRFLRPGAMPGSAYVEFEVPKRSGGTRTLAAPRAALKKIQRRLLEVVFDPLPVHPACHAFTRGRSLLTNTAPHRAARLIVKCDLRDFFPTITERRVVGLLDYYGYDASVAHLIARLTTYRRVDPDGNMIIPGILPQGAPTSPAIANLICRQLDARLAGLAQKCGGRYTRYADDLTFSFDRDPPAGIGRLFWWVDQICAQEGFSERPDKRRVLRPHQRQLVTGLVVNDGQRVPRAARRRFRALLHHLETNGVDKDGRPRAELRAYVLGFASWLAMCDGARDARLIARAGAIYK